MFRRTLSFGSSHKLACLGFALTLTLVAPALQAAEQAGTYRVAPGDTLSGIAARHEVTVAQLCAENGISRDRILRSGQLLKLPTKKAASAKASKDSKPSASPSNSAERPKVASSTTSKASKPQASPSNSTERPGSLPRVSPALAKQVPATPAEQSPKPKSASEGSSAKPPGPATPLGPAEPDAKPAARTTSSCGNGSHSGSLAKCLPEKPLPAPHGQARATTSDAAKPSWLAYSRRPAKPGYLHLQSTVGEWSGQAVVGNWHIPENARAGIARALASWRSGAEERIHGRLIRLLVRVSDQFGGRPIRVVSGYRPHKESRYTPHSKHTLGRAVDFSIPGVPNAVLRDYLRAAFKDVGVGYYPNSTHVHLDIREEDTYWVDYSSPGQAPSYGAPPRAKTPASGSLAASAGGNSPGVAGTASPSGTGSSGANTAAASPETAPGTGADVTTSASAVSQNRAPSNAAPSNTPPSNTTPSTTPSASSSSAAPPTAASSSAAPSNATSPSSAPPTAASSSAGPSTAASSSAAPSNAASSNAAPSSPTPPLAHRSPPSP